MELLPVLIIIYVVYSLVKNSKKVAQQKPGRAAGPATPTASPSTIGGLGDIIGMFAKDEEEAPPKPEKEEMGEGESAGDETGCLGGSIPHASVHEGAKSPRAPISYAAPEGMAATTRVEDLAARTLVSPTKWTSAKMREAVIASEILKPPKGARRRKLAG